MEDKHILEIFQNSQDPFLFTGEVADELGFSNEGAFKRLEKLEQRGFLESKRTGRVPGWWLTEAGREYLRSTSD